MEMGWEALEARVREVFSDEDLAFQIVKRIPNIGELFDRIISCYKLNQEDTGSKIILLPGDYHRFMLLGMLLPYFVVEAKYLRVNELLKLYVDTLRGLAEWIRVPSFILDSVTVLERVQERFCGSRG